MTSQVIPEAAVEAALRAAEERYRSDDPTTWEQIARDALEAASPHMLAEAWEAGWSASTDWNIYMEMGGDEPECDNPYKSQD